MSGLFFDVPGYDEIILKNCHPERSDSGVEGSLFKYNDPLYILSEIPAFAGMTNQNHIRGFSHETSYGSP